MVKQFLLVAYTRHENSKEQRSLGTLFFPKRLKKFQIYYMLNYSSSQKSQVMKFLEPILTIPLSISLVGDGKRIKF